MARKRRILSFIRRASPSLPDDLRAACAEVAASARHVRIDRDAIAPYAAALAAAGLPAPASAPPVDGLQREHAAAAALTLDAINFGSGWFPTLRKRPGLSGYRTIAAGLQERFAAAPWSAAELVELQAPALAATLGQDPEHELMALFAASLRDLGDHLQRDHGGSFAALVDAADGSALALVAELASWECFADESRYAGRRLPFLKRAQIAAADLVRAGAARLHDLDRLTVFADNLVPHVLACDGVLALDPWLAERIAREQLLEHGSPEEVELRACTVHAGELLVAALRAGGHEITAAQLDTILWERGGRRAYKASPRPRCRCTAY